MNFDNNKEIDLAYNFVFNTNKNIFLTGKAGTGKTTFLKNIRNLVPKRMIIVAPTGVAAINAGGVTIHSFFQLPFSPFVPKNSASAVSGENLSSEKENAYSKNKLNKNKVKIIKSLDLLVIDEISMVRADLLDAIDDVLRTYRRSNKPFGGVQLLMIGDLYQLAPVIKDEEWNIIQDFYKTSYFFGSNALQKTDFLTIELTHIYRQSDETFIKLLGEIRENKLSAESLETLNSRYVPDFIPEENEGFITLTTHNSLASDINETRLKALNEKSVSLKAKIYDEFPEYMYPTEETLVLKHGAQVMFVKNDSSCDKLYYNGKIGKVTRIEDDIVYVKCTDDFSEIPAIPETWNNVKYSLNEDTKEIEETITGRFEQYPLKLAWAITIHKSQGLTFDKAVIDVNAAFAFGQVYVALSRCKTLNGLVLMSKVSPYGIKSDITVKEFNNDVNENPPDEKKLRESQLHYQKGLVAELFDFTELRKSFYYLRKLFYENANKFEASFANIIAEIEISARAEIFEISDKFLTQISHLTNNEILPQENAVLQERIKKAANYYVNKLHDIFYKKLKDIYFDSDNKEIRKTIAESLEKFERTLFIKVQCLDKCLSGFDTQIYLKAVSISDIEFKPEFNRKKAMSQSSEFSKPEQNELYAEINAWRKMTAEESDIPLYMVLPQKTLKELIRKLPSNFNQLYAIKGLGKAKVNKYGEEILEIIDSYCERNDIQRDETEIEELKPKKAPKPDTKLLSLEMFRDGKSIKEIAEARGFAESTIYGHLGYFISKGELDIEEIMPLERVNEIVGYLEMQDTISLRRLYEDADKKYSYSELKIVMSYLESKDNTV